MMNWVKSPEVRHASCLACRTCSVVEPFPPPRELGEPLAASKLSDAAAASEIHHRLLRLLSSAPIKIPEILIKALA